MNGTVHVFMRRMKSESVVAGQRSKDLFFVVVGVR